MELQTERNTPRRDGETLVLGVKSGVMIYAGALVAREREGFAVPGYQSATLRGLGRCEASTDGRGFADGHATVEVRKGVFRFDNHNIDTVTMAHVGQDCYIADDHTVACTTDPGELLEDGSIARHVTEQPRRGVAGIVYDVDATGVWVRFQ